MKSTELPPELRLNRTKRSTDSQELCEHLTELDYLGMGLNKRCYSDHSKKVNHNCSAQPIGLVWQ